MPRSLLTSSRSSSSQRERWRNAPTATDGDRRVPRAGPCGPHERESGLPCVADEPPYVLSLPAARPMTNQVLDATTLIGQLGERLGE